MGATLLSFMERYYEYDGDCDIEDKGLTMGGYESAWLADLVVAFVLEKTKHHFDNSEYHGIYRDDGIAVVKGRKSYRDIVTWLDGFQQSVNHLVGGDFLQFTCQVWLDESRYRPVRVTDPNKVTAETRLAFPYLHMELHWAPNNGLRFRVHLKPNQQLKYLNKGSSHTKACFTSRDKLCSM